MEKKIILEAFFSIKGKNDLEKVTFVEVPAYQFRHGHHKESWGEVIDEALKSGELQLCKWTDCWKLQSQLTLPKGVKRDLWHMVCKEIDMPSEPKSMFNIYIEHDADHVQGCHEETGIVYPNSSFRHQRAVGQEKMIFRLKKQRK